MLVLAIISQRVAYQLAAEGHASKIEVLLERAVSMLDGRSGSFGGVSA
jgi:hypothetical protein